MTMTEDAARQLILAFENYLSQAGFGAEALTSAQSRGWLNQDGQTTQEGKALCAALAAQLDTRSAFRNFG
jgi:hypothetical protein